MSELKTKDLMLDLIAEICEKISGPEDYFIVKVNYGLHGHIGWATQPGYKSLTKRPYVTITQFYLRETCLIMTPIVMKTWPDFGWTQLDEVRIELSNPRATDLITHFIVNALDKVIKAQEKSEKRAVSLSWKTVTPLKHLINDNPRDNEKS